MYTDFFGLNRRPFELSPDPSFLFSSEKSKEALASISYAIFQRKGFVVMTGEVGTGKTLMVRCLFKSWRDQGIAFANIFAPNLSVIDFLSYAAADLGIEVTEPTKGNLLRALYGFIAAQFEKGLTTVLVIDEAHQMSMPVLEEIRMLTNVETDQQKLVQVLLVGQPELDRKLDSFELRQLKQRIAIRCQLEPLREEETRQYIERRLNLAGASAQAKTIFPPETVKAIYGYSRGTPRLVNTICDQALVAAYAVQVRVVPVEIIDVVGSYLRLQSTSNREETKQLLLLGNQTEKSVSDKSWQVARAVKVPPAKPPNPTFLRNENGRNDTPAETKPPSKPGTSYGSGLRDIVTEKSVSAKSWQAAPAVNLPAAKPPDPPFLPDVNARNGTSAEATPPRKPEGSSESNFRHIPGVFNRSEEGFTPYKPTQRTIDPDIIRDLLGDFALGSVNRPAQAVCLRSDRAALSGSLTSVTAPPVIPVEPVEPWPSGRTRTSTSAAESMKSTAMQSPAPEPAVKPNALPVDDLRAIWQRGQISEHTRPYQAGRWLEPMLRVSQQVVDRIHLWAQEWPASKKFLIIGTAALAVVCLTIGGMMLRRQARAATIVQQVATSQENFPAGRTTASMQPQLESSAMKLNARSAGSIVPGLGGESSKSTRMPELATPRPKIEIGKLSRPVLRSPGLSISSELPPVMATQTKELVLGNGLLDSSAPTRPGASTGGHLRPPKLVSSPAPAYPSLARMEKLQGVVVIDALVDATGRVTDMKVISGPAGLLPAAMAALHTWKYEPALLDGEPIPMHMKVSVNFGLH